ncbi:unnamed protein product [Closterium sp. Naga37s-1]|nr:unnamed protein product [Closterium sp. Naga37s-1]
MFHIQLGNERAAAKTCGLYRSAPITRPRLRVLVFSTRIGPQRGIEAACDGGSGRPCGGSQQQACFENPQLTTSEAAQEASEQAGPVGRSSSDTIALPIAFNPLASHSVHEQQQEVEGGAEAITLHLPSLPSHLSLPHAPAPQTTRASSRWRLRGRAADGGGGAGEAAEAPSTPPSTPSPFSPFRPLAHLSASCHGSTDYEGKQQMEVEALEAILILRGRAADGGGGVGQTEAIITILSSPSLPAPPLPSPAQTTRASSRWRLRGRAADGDYEGEQQMEVEALEAILMDEFERVDDTSGLGLPADKPCYLITISPKGDDEEETTPFPVRLALYFAHTPTYPDEPPLLSLRR